MTEPKADLKVVNDIKIAAWNKSIAPRAPSLLSYLSAGEFVEGILPWWRSIEHDLLQKLVVGCKDRDTDQFVRGQIAMIQELIDLPNRIDATIRAKEDSEKKAASRGTAGY